MTSQDPLHPELGQAFPVRTARAYGTSRSRLRGRDLAAPFHGVRVRTGSDELSDVAHAAGIEDPYERQRRTRVARARLYLPRLHTGHFFSHETAASIWGAPLPLRFDVHGAPAAELDLHVCAPGGLPLPRAAGIVGHRSLASMVDITTHIGLRVSSPAATWAMLGGLPMVDLVALGDYFCRQWRTGYGRPEPGHPPLSTVDDLRTALNAGRRLGADRLRTALELIREDSWSPRESRVRVLLLDAGLPEPDLNVDVFDDDGCFLACLDLAYPGARVAVEYMGMLHSRQWARDVERLARLRAAGWTIIEVTTELFARPQELVRRVAAALR